MCRSTLHTFPWRAPSCLSIGRSLYQTIQIMFPDSSIAKIFKCSGTKATAVLKVIAQDCWKTFPQQLETLNTSASRLMRQLILLLHNKLLLCFDSSITPKDR